MLTGQIWTGMEYDEFSINGTSKPNDQYNGVTNLGGAWKRQQTAFEGMCPYTVDCPDELVKVLGTDLTWRINPGFQQAAEESLDHDQIVETVSSVHH